MGKGKSTKQQHKRGRPGALSAGDAVEDNPFEQRGIVRKKHEVFNRRVKGEHRNVAKARSRAVERRKKTLLVDFESDKKANFFEDRRFGEDDPGLTLEEKMWARMQKERKQRSRGSSMFNLADEDSEEELLTHKGKALADDYNDWDQEPSDDEELGADVVDRLHFGGGQGASSGHSQGGKAEKTHKDVLDEMIAKSKAHKQEKARNKQEQEGETEKLDQDFGKLLGMLNQRPAKGQSRERERGAARGEIDDYDRTMRELAFEARARATNRSKAPEEIAREEKEKLEELEKARIRRMNSEVPEEEAESESSAPAQGSVARRQAPNDDELEDDMDMPLGQVVVFPKGSQALEGVDMDHQSDSSDGDSDDSSDDDDDEDEEEEEEEEEREERDREGSEDDEDGGEDPSGEDEEDDLHGEADALEEAAARAAQVRRAAAEEMPYVLACPSTYQELLSMLSKHARSSADINTMIDRIRKYHSVKLDSRNKERMHTFYGVLLTRFQRVAEQVKLAGGGDMDRVEQLDFLTGVLYDITAEIPDAAGSLWHRTLGIMHKRLAQALEDRSMSSLVECWPSKGTLLLLKLMLHLFPATDLRHPVVTPAVLFLSQCLSQCPVDGPSDVVKGLLCSALLLSSSLGAKRVAPEALSFLASILAKCGPGHPRHASASAPTAQVATPALRTAPLAWLRRAGAQFAGPSIPAMDLRVNLGPSDGDDKAKGPRSGTPELSASVLGTTYKLVAQAMRGLEDSPAFPELFLPLLEALQQVRPLDAPCLPKPLQELHVHVLEDLVSRNTKVLGARRPLVWQAKQVQHLEALVPRFQDDYKVKKDGDKDTEHAKSKQLARLLSRERKGALRELKRDAAFLEHVKWEKKNQQDQDRKRKLHENTAWLQGQQATFKQQVSSKTTNSLIRGGGSGSKKRPKVGRG